MIQKIKKQRKHSGRKWKELRIKETQQREVERVKNKRNTVEEIEKS